MVAETGCDPTGAESCADAIESAARAGRALEFPSGRYRIDRPLSVEADGPVGFLGPEARLVPEQGFNDMVLSADAPGVWVDGLDVDIRAPETTAGLSVTAETWFRVDDVTYHGRGDHPARKAPFAFDLVIREPQGYGLARGLTATQGTAIGHYDNGAGRGGIWVGPPNQGTVRIENCRLAEFANNGVYGSRTAGNVEVIGGVFRNNNVASLRLGGQGSFVRDAHVEIDVDAYEGPRTRLDDQFATRGIVVEQGPTTNIKPPGAAIRNCTLAVHSTPANGAAISAWSTARTLSIVDTTITVDVDDFRALFRAPRRQSGNRAPSDLPRWVRADGLDVRGDAAGGETVRLADAPASWFRDCRIAQSGRGRAGIHLLASPDTAVDGGRIATDGVPLRLTDFDSITPESCLLSVTGDPVVSGGQATPGGDSALTAEACLSPADVPADARAIRVLGVSGDRLTYRVDRE